MNRANLGQFEARPGQKLRLPRRSNVKPGDCMQITKELGMKLTPIEETWTDMATTMIALGVAKPVSK